MKIDLRLVLIIPILYFIISIVINFTVSHKTSIISKEILKFYLNNLELYEKVNDQNYLESVTKINANYSRISNITEFHFIDLSDELSYSDFAFYTNINNINTLYLHMKINVYKRSILKNNLYFGIVSIIIWIALVILLKKGKSYEIC